MSFCIIGCIPASAAAAPPIATTEAAIGVSYEEATLKGTVNPEGSATSYYFEYGPTESYGTKIPLSPESVGSGTSNVSVRQLVTGLSQGTTYHFRVVAEGETTAKGKDLTFSTAGFNFEFGKEGSGEGQFNRPFDTAVDGEGNIWVTDTENNRVEKFNTKGEYLEQIGKEGVGDGEFKSPKGIAIDSIGNLWIVDSGNNRVQVFNSKGKYVSKFGEKGSGEGQFSSPSGIAFDAADRPFIADTGNNRIEKFNFSFKFLAQFGKEGTGDGELMSPEGVLIDAKGRIWVTDTGNDRVQRFNPSTFKYVSQFGKEGTGNGEFKSPIGIVNDFQEKLWIVDSGNNRAQKFSIEGEYLDQIGKEGSGAGQFKAPTGIAAPAAQKLLVLDAGNDRVEGWTVKAELPTVFTAPVTEITSSSAILHATINPLGFATTYYFEWGLTTSYGNQVPATPESIGSGLSNVQVEQAIGGLTENTTYHVRAVAENVTGVTFGNDRTFKTLKP